MCAPHRSRTWESINKRGGRLKQIKQQITIKDQKKMEVYSLFMNWNNKYN